MHLQAQTATIAPVTHLKLPASMPFSFHMYTPSATPIAVMPLLQRVKGFFISGQVRS